MTKVTFAVLNLFIPITQKYSMFKFSVFTHKLEIACGLWFKH